MGRKNRPNEATRKKAAEESSPTAAPLQGGQGDDRRDDAMAFLLRLGRALHAYGSPAHRLEAALDRAARRLGYHGQFFSNPTSLFISLAGDGRTRTEMARMDPGQVHLEKLGLLEDVLSGLDDGSLSPAEADRRVTGVLEAPPRYGAVATTLAFAFASGSAARFFTGAWREMAMATVVGLVIGLLAVLAGRIPRLGRLFEPASALAAAALATAGAILAPAWGWGDLSPYVATVAGLIVLIPGLTLTVAMTELATQHLISGSARLAGALVTFLTIAFGVALGQRAVEVFLGPAPDVVPAVLPGWTELAALGVTAVALAVLFRGHPRDIPWIFIAALVALQGTRLGSELLGPQLGAFLGAVMVGAGSNLYGRLLGRPTAVTSLPGLMLLVPGSLGFRSLSLLIAKDVITGIEAAFQVTLVAVALVTGLLIANVLVPPRRVL